MTMEVAADGLEGSITVVELDDRLGGWLMVEG